jgi:hypothetical protein
MEETSLNLAQPFLLVCILAPLGLIYFFVMVAAVRYTIRKSDIANNKLRIFVSWLISPFTWFWAFFKDVIDALMPMFEIAGIGVICLLVILASPLILAIYLTYLCIRFLIVLGDRILLNSLKYVK